MTPTRPIDQVLAEHTPGLMALAGVTAVGETTLEDGRPCIRVYIRAHDRSLEARIPREIEGYRVLIAVSGDIRAMPGNQR